MPKYNLSVFGRTTSFETDQPLGSRLLNTGTPNTNADSVQTSTRYSFGGQEVTRDELLQIRDMRTSGGIIATLFRLKALMMFGAGVEFQAGDEESPETHIVDGQEMTLEEYLYHEFADIDTLTLELGEDAVWFPFAAGEIVSTRGGGFSHFQPIEPWTLEPVQDRKGDIVQWEQTVEHNGQKQTETYDADDIVHFVLTKKSARDNIGVSDAIRAKEEIMQFKENQQAVRGATQLHAYPQRHVKVGREGMAPVRDQELRRIRTLFDPRTTDANTAYFTGQDVDIDTLEASNFDFEAIARNDLHQLALAIGLPIELVNFGTEGLGSGQSRLRDSILKLDIQAMQQCYAERWVNQVIRPVVRNFSPFDADKPIDMRFGEPITDPSEIADMVTSIREETTLNERREKLDLPKRDEEEADIPTELREDEGGDDPFGGGGGLFSQSRELDQPGFPISSRDECDGSVVQGPQGGLRCIPSEGSDSSEGVVSVSGPEDIPEGGFSDDQLGGVLDDITPNAESVDNGDVTSDSVGAMNTALPKNVGESQWWGRHTRADETPEKGDVVSIRDGGTQTAAVVVDQDGVPEGGLRIMTPEGEDTVSLRSSVTHTLDTTGEIDAPDNEEIVEARDPDEASETVSADEFGFTGGRNIDQMQVHTYDDGSFTVETDFSGREEFGQRATAASDIVNKLGGSSPEHRFENGSLFVGGVDGTELGEVDPQEVDKESLTDTLAAAAITGDGDLNRDSFIVDESGRVHVIDLEMASFGNMGPDNALNNIENMIESLELPVDSSEIEERMQEMSEETSRSDLVDGSEFDEMAMDISANLSSPKKRFSNSKLLEGGSDFSDTEHRCLSAPKEQFAGSPEWDTHLVAMHRKLWDDSQTRLMNFSETQTPEFVKERLREAIMGGAIFSDFETVPSGELMQLREYMTETLESDGWTIDGLADQLQQIDGLEDRNRAMTVARTETASVVNTAREEGYLERGEGDDLFYWSGNLDGRTTEACRWLIEQTNPFHGGEPVPLEELKELIEEAPTHDPDMQDDLARPDNFVVHPSERKTFSRFVEGMV